MKNKERELIILQPANFYLDTYCMPSRLLSIGDTEVKGTWLLPLKLMVSKGVQEAIAKCMGRQRPDHDGPKVAAGDSQEVAPPFRQEVRKSCCTQSSNTPKEEGPESRQIL